MDCVFKHGVRLGFFTPLHYLSTMKCFLLAAALIFAIAATEGMWIFMLKWGKVSNKVVLCLQSIGFGGVLNDCLKVLFLKKCNEQGIVWDYEPFWQ